MQGASLLFSSGSGLLLLGVLSYFWTNRWNDAGNPSWFIVLSWLAVVVHGMGYAVLFSGILQMGPEPLFQRLSSLVLGSLLFIVVGLLTLPIFFPADPNAGYYFPPWFVVLAYGIFPHVPTVFGPAAMAHGTVFVLASKDLVRPGSRVATIAGGAALLLIGTSGIAVQLIAGMPQSLPSPLARQSFLASLTLIGYILVAGGFTLEGIPRETGPHSLVA
jgi:hypothetical protein